MIKNFFLKLIKSLQPPSLGDRNFKKKFQDVVNKEIKRAETEKEIIEHVSRLIRGRPENQIYEINKITSRFFEFFNSLVLRYSEIREVEWEIHYFDNLREKRPLKEIQADLVNKTESFHQELYATLSAFIKLLSHISPDSFKGQMPNSVSKFLTYIKSKIETINNSVEVLEKSTGEYRVNYVDHLSRSPSYNWYTFSGPNGKVYIVYFRGEGKGNFIDLTQLINSPITIKTLFPVEAIFVPPHHSDTLKSFIIVVTKTLKFLINTSLTT